MPSVSAQTWSRLALLMALLPIACTAADAPLLAGKADCRFEAPEGWRADVRWTGPCSAGRAHGRGVVREFSARGRVNRFYFGSLIDGRLSLGVIQQDDGYQAGQFKAAKLLPGLERNTLIKAFEEGSTAAKSVAAQYLREGNAASAKFYQDRAAELANQMD